MELAPAAALDPAAASPAAGREAPLDTGSSSGDDRVALGEPLILKAPDHASRLRTRSPTRRASSRSASSAAWLSRFGPLNSIGVAADRLMSKKWKCSHCSPNPIR